MPSSPFIVAEMSANHLGHISRAHLLIEAAADAGADAIKLQTWVPGTMCVSDYKLESGPWKGALLKNLYKMAHTPWEWHAPLFEHARERGLIPFSAAFDMASVDFLETLGVDRHKVASFELVDLPLIRYMASKGKPMILSTGMATEDELWAAIGACRDPATLTLLKCTSAYPADASDANLATFHGQDDGVRFWDGMRWGLSDHTLGIGVAVAAVALGATYIEKHLTLSRADGGPDAGFSAEPHEFKQMVEECRRAAQAIGVPSYGPGPGESTDLRRSLWVIKDVRAGEMLSLNINVATARPALGLPPSTNLAGNRASRDLKAGTPLTQECIA
jgi:pseudaminic acid synthase